MIGSIATTAITAGFKGATAAPRVDSASRWFATVSSCDKVGQFDSGATRVILECHKQIHADGIAMLDSVGKVPSFSVAERRLEVETALNKKDGPHILIGLNMSNTRDNRPSSVYRSERSYQVKRWITKAGLSIAGIAARHAVAFLLAGLMMTSSLAAAQIMSTSGQVDASQREACVELVAHVLKSNGCPVSQTAPGEPTQAPAPNFIEAGRPSYAVTVAAQRDIATTPTSTNADPNGNPGPYQVLTGFLKMPPGRTMGSTSAVAVDSKGHVWVAERCGANDCQDSPLDPILEFDGSGRFVKAFGAGMFVFPHSLYIDGNDNIWLADGRAAAGKGAQVVQFASTGKVLLRLGRAGVSAEGANTFLEPVAVIVALDGSIFVADGHTPNKPARVVKFDATGRFLKQWGSTGDGPRQFNVPHALAMDSKRRLFVGDRGNNRIQIYDEEGTLLDSWTQFGRPSGLYIDGGDVLYVADSESREPEGYGHHPGWQRGIRIGSVADGKVTTFIPDPTPDVDKKETSGAEGIWVDGDGVIYGAEVFRRTITRYVRK